VKWLRGELLPADAGAQNTVLAAENAGFVSLHLQPATMHHDQQRLQSLPRDRHSLADCQKALPDGGHLFQAIQRRAHRHTSKLGIDPPIA
jgi:hypothetical protein